jgi:hypothetical protein
VFEELSADDFRSRRKLDGPNASSSKGAIRRRSKVATACREAAAKSPVGGVESLIERSIGYALHQARRPEEARPHFEESLRIARELKVQYEVALTLRAMAATHHPTTEDLAAQSDEILEGLGVVSLAPVPLP